MIGIAAVVGRYRGSPMKMLPFALLLASTAPALAAAAAAGGPAATNCTVAPETATPLFVGIMTQDVTVTCPDSRPVKAHVVAVDVDAPGLSFEASNGLGPVFQTELPTAFLVRTGSQIAFNANLFVNCCQYDGSAPTLLQGLEIAGGQIHSPAGSNPDPAQDYPFDTSLAAAGGRLAILPSDLVPAGTGAAVTGSHVLVVSGQNVAPTTPGSVDSFFGLNARTLVGLSTSNRTLWVVAVDGSDRNAGLTLPQAAQLLISLGAATALNLDGGGSTALAADAGDGTARLLNVLSGPQRYVGASFGIHAAALPPARPKRRPTSH